MTATVDWRQAEFEDFDLPEITEGDDFGWL
jgi:hypothetical protein